MSTATGVTGTRLGIQVPCVTTNCVPGHQHVDKFLFCKFKEVPLWPSREIVDNNMPQVFRNLYPTRCIIDATEVFIEKPRNPSAQQLTFSNYKNCNTFKVLIAISPAGAVSFVSDLYGGNISDKHLTAVSRLPDLLEEGDTVMAD